MQENSSGVWGHFRKAWPYHCERLEPSFDSGLPDVLIQDRCGVAGLVELKAPDAIVLRPSQKAWFRRWQETIGNTGITAIPTVTCTNHGGKVVWKVLRYAKPEKHLVWALRAAIKKDEGRWISKEEMVHLVLIMNGLEPYLE
jgi:hypothetical protein